MNNGLKKTRHSVWIAIKHYAYGLFSKSFNGAIAAVYAFVGQAVGAGLDPAHFNIPDWRTIAYTFCVVFSISALGYFKDNPLPDKLPETTPPFASTTEIKDGKITTTADDAKALETKPPFPTQPSIQ